MADASACPDPLRSELHHGDCLDIMPRLPQQSVQMTFADLPYGITGCEWDVCIDLDKFWHQLSHLDSHKAARIFTAVQPFTTALIASRPKDFRQELVWHKKRPTGFFHAKSAPLRAHESVVVFCEGKPAYYPQMVPGKRFCVTTKEWNNNLYGKTPDRTLSEHDGKMRYPRSVLAFDESDLRRDSLNGHTKRLHHPTKKPIALVEFLIKSYTNPGDTVLDPVMGSATTGVACLRTGRHFIGIEKDAAYFAIAQKRVAAERLALGLPP